MNRFGKIIWLHTALAILIVFLTTSQSSAEDCPRAVALYNQAIDEEDLTAKERLLKKAIPLCSAQEVLSRIYNNLADVYEKRGQLSLALTFYKKALEARPDLVTAYLSVGDIFFRLKDYYSAALMYEKARQYGPEDAADQRAREEAHKRAKTLLMVYFNLDDFKIPDRYVKRLDALCDAVQDMDQPVEIRITGHTCDLGPRAYNRRLSLKRAREVGRYVAERLRQGSATLHIEDNGEDTPLLAGRDANARELARRVEIQVRVRSTLSARVSCETNWGLWRRESHGKG